MISVAEHLNALLDGLDPLSPLDLQLLDALGCILAEDVIAPWDLPLFDNSAMDGYAVRAGDVATASESSPVILPVVGDIPAGSTNAYGLGDVQTLRIMTGAPMPHGADAVVPLEWTDGGIVQVSITRAPEPGAHVRRQGEDVSSGTRVLDKGTRVGPAQIAVLAATGRSRIVVRPRPRVVVFSTGSELVEPGAPLRSGQIPDSNSYMLAAAVKEAGAVAYRVAIVPDEPQRLLDTIEDQLIRADLVLTTGGVSVGAYDVVKEALTRLGTVTFTTVAMQPGKPQGYGTVGPDKTPIVTLPGNPVSAFVSFEVFVRPMLRRMLGLEPLHRPSVRAVCRGPLRSPEGKRQFLRARLEVEDGSYVAHPIGGAGSHLLMGMAQANAFIVLPEDVTAVADGDAVTVMMLERRVS